MDTLEDLGQTNFEKNTIKISPSLDCRSGQHPGSFLSKWELWFVPRLKNAGIIHAFGAHKEFSKLGRLRVAWVSVDKDTMLERWCATDDSIAGNTQERCATNCEFTFRCWHNCKRYPDKDFKWPFEMCANKHSLCTRSLPLGGLSFHFISAFSSK